MNAKCHSLAMVQTCASVTFHDIPFSLSMMLLKTTVGTKSVDREPLLLWGEGRGSLPSSSGDPQNPAETCTKAAESFTMAPVTTAHGQCSFSAATPMPLY